MLFYRSPAKINLSLDILSRRPDGYHELQSVVHCVGLFDTISIDISSSSGLSLRCSDASLNSEQNLCLLAAEAWRRAVKSSEGKRNYFPGLRITLDKKIPIGAGLGGGSGNAAATLLALNTRFGSPLSREQLLEIAAELGSDVPLFFEGGCALLEGVGERLRALPALPGWVVLIQPPQQVSTAQVYECFDEIAADSEQSTPALLEAMHSQELREVGSRLSNDLQNAAERLGVDTALPARLLEEQGALGAQMSGAGSASFGLFPDASAAQNALRKIRDDHEWPEDYRAFAAPLLAGGVEALAT